MSVDLGDVLKSAGYNLDNLEDAKWFLAQKDEVERLTEQAEETCEKEEE